MPAKTTAETTKPSGSDAPICSPSFASRTDELASKLGVNLQDLPGVIGIGRASFFCYRTGNRKATQKVLLKLEKAEVAAGVKTSDHLKKIGILEREVTAWKANHDNQVALKRIIASRPDLKERAPLVEKLMAERNRAQSHSIRQHERIKLLESTLGKWLEWARMHGHLDHAAGLADDSRRLISTENAEAIQPRQATPTKSTNE